MANATTYFFPVIFKKVNGLNVEKMFNKDIRFLNLLIEAGRELVEKGVRAITGDCGFMALSQWSGSSRGCKSSGFWFCHHNKLCLYEETYGGVCGSKAVIEGGVLENPQVNAVMALYLWTPTKIFI